MDKNDISKNISLNKKEIPKEVVVNEDETEAFETPL